MHFFQKKNNRTLLTLIFVWTTGLFFTSALGRNLPALGDEVTSGEIDRQVKRAQGYAYYGMDGFFGMMLNIQSPYEDSLRVALDMLEGTFEYYREHGNKDGQREVLQNMLLISHWLDSDTAYYEKVRLELKKLPKAKKEKQNWFYTSKERNRIVKAWTESDYGEIRRVGKYFLKHDLVGSWKTQDYRNWEIKTMKKYLLKSFFMVYNGKFQPGMELMGVLHDYYQLRGLDFLKVDVLFLMGLTHQMKLDYQLSNQRLLEMEAIIEKYVGFEQYLIYSQFVRAQNLYNSKQQDSAFVRFSAINDKMESLVAEHPEREWLVFSTLNSKLGLLYLEAGLPEQAYRFARRSISQLDEKSLSFEGMNAFDIQRTQMTVVSLLHYAQMAYLTNRAEEAMKYSNLFLVHMNGWINNTDRLFKLSGIKFQTNTNQQKAFEALKAMYHEGEAVLYSQLGEVELALESQMKGLDHFPNDSMIQKMTGIIRVVERASFLDKDSLALLYLNLFDEYNEVQNHPMFQAASQYHHAVLLKKEGKYGEALALLGEGLEENRQNLSRSEKAMYLQLMGELSSLSGEDEMALAILKDSVDYEALTAKPLVFLSTLRSGALAHAQKTGNDKFAMETCEKVFQFLDDNQVNKTGLLSLQFLQENTYPFYTRAASIVNGQGIPDSGLSILEKGRSGLLTTLFARRLMSSEDIWPKESSEKYNYWNGKVRTYTKEGLLLRLIQINTKKLATN